LVLSLVITWLRCEGIRLIYAAGSIALFLVVELAAYLSLAD